MKQLLFLLLFPCLAMAQYTGNAGQKITLGEQTTADGLVWRGRTSDTVNLMTNKIDTSAYLVLDTITEAIWLYRASTTPKWNRVVDSLNNLQGQLSLTSKVTGVLPVANGGTGQTTLAAAGIVTGTGTTNYLPKFTSASAIGNSNFFNDASGNVGIGTTLPASRFHIKQSADAHSGGLKLERFSATNTYSLNIDANNNLNLGYATTASTSTNRLVIDANGNVGVGITPSAWRNIFTAFQFGLTGSFYALIPSFNAEEMNFASNYYQDSDGLERRIINGYTERLRLKSGRFEFDAAGFGLSNSVISFNRRLLIDSTGNVGIGTSSPVVQLHTTGNVRFAGLTSITDLQTDADGDLVSGSDYNLKNSIEPINSGINEVLKLNPVQFYWNKESRNLLNKNYGFIAQDVMIAIPNAASTMGDGFMQVDYNAIVATLTKAIQEQNALIKALEQRILILENK